MDNLDYDNLIAAFLAQVPELTCLYENELEKWGEVLNYSFFGVKLVRAVRLLYRFSLQSSTKVVATDGLTRLLDFLEMAAGSDNESIMEVVQNGFIEGFYKTGTDAPFVAALLRPAMRQMLENIGGLLPYKDDERDSSTYRFVDDCIAIWMTNATLDE